MTAPTTVAIVGGGLLGLTLAHRLHGPTRRIIILEGAGQHTGFVAPPVLGDFSWDRLYHAILPGDRSLLRLLDELHLGASVHWKTTRTGFFAKDRLYSLSSPWDYMRFPGLSPWAKARLAATVLRARQRRSGLALERVGGDRWLRSHSGEQAYQRFWRPLLRSKLGENHRLTSAAFIWAYIRRRLYGARRGLRQRETLGYVTGGYAEVLRRLEASLLGRGVEIRYRTSVRAVRQTDEGVVIEAGEPNAAKLKAQKFDFAVLTVPAGRAAAICPQLSVPERRRLEGVVYQGVICGSVLLTRPLSGSYLTTIADDTIPFTSVVEMTALVDPKRFGGHTLVYLPLFLPPDAIQWGWSDRDVRDRFGPALLRMFPELGAEDVRHFQVERAKDIQALSTPNYTRDVLPATRTSLPNILVVNSAQIVNGILNLSETVALANRKAREILSYLHETRRGRLAATAAHGG